VTDDPRPWQHELVAVAERLEAKTKQGRWTDRTGFLIERDFAVGAYVVRKLVESGTVTDELSRYSFPVLRFERTEEPIDSHSIDDVSEVYDLENGSRRALSVTELCDEIMHNLAFAFCCGETADLYDGVYVTSERNVNEFVYLVLASDFIALCGDVGAQAGA
jgi:hypothetical protein